MIPLHHYLSKMTEDENGGFAISCGERGKTVLSQKLCNSIKAPTAEGKGLLYAKNAHVYFPPR
jgi:hypothetical protein